MGTVDDPGLLLIGKEVLLPFTALAVESRLKKTSGVTLLSFKGVRQWDLMFCLFVYSHCSLMEAQNGFKNRCLSV